MKRNLFTNREGRMTRRLRKGMQAHLMAAYAYSRAEAKDTIPASLRLCEWETARRQTLLRSVVAFDALGDPTWTERDEQELLRYNAGPIPV